MVVSFLGLDHCLAQRKEGKRPMKVLHMLATAALLAMTASPAFSATFDTVFCGAESDAIAVKDAVMKQSSLQQVVDVSAIQGSGCMLREFDDLSTAGFTPIDPKGNVTVGIVAIDDGYAVAIDFPDL